MNWTPERGRRYHTWFAAAAFLVFGVLVLAAFTLFILFLAQKDYRRTWMVIGIFALIGAAMLSVVLRWRSKFDAFVELDRAAAAWIRHSEPSGQTTIYREDVVDVVDGKDALTIRGRDSTIVITRIYMRYPAIRNAVLRWRTSAR